MYISVYPVAMSIRRTNVYEENSLGIYTSEEEEDTSFLGISSILYAKIATHIGRQLSFDLWYVFLGVFIICIVESAQIQNAENYVGGVIVLIDI